MDFLADLGSELKEHYLKSIVEFIEKIPVESFKEKSNKKINSIFETVIDEWISDAQSNQLLFFFDYLKNFKNVLQTTKEIEPSAKYVMQIKQYAEKLVAGEEDTIALAKSFAVIFDDSKIYLQCILDVHEFAVPIQNVVEIITEREVFPLPDRRKDLLGLINFRGEGVPIVNLSTHGFEVKAKHENCLHVICEYEGTRFGIGVTKTDEVISLSEKQMQKVSDNSIIQGAKFVEKFYLKGEKTILVFNLHKLVA